MPGRRSRSERISERDLEVLEFIARFGVVPRDARGALGEYGKAMTFGGRPSARGGADRGPPGLRRVGPIAGRDPAQPASLRAEELGGRGSLLGPPATRSSSPGWPRGSKRGGEQLLSEREIAAADIEGARIYSAEPAGRPQRFHRPDLVRLGPAPEAIEVELTNKTPTRLDALLRGWRRALGQGSSAG